MQHLAQEAMNVVYVDNEPMFCIKGNGSLKWYRLTPATMDDMQEMFKARDVGNGGGAVKLVLADRTD